MAPNPDGTHHATDADHCFHNFATKILHRPKKKKPKPRTRRRRRGGDGDENSSEEDGGNEEDGDDNDDCDGPGDGDVEGEGDETEANARLHPGLGTVLRCLDDGEEEDDGSTFLSATNIMRAIVELNDPLLLNIGLCAYDKHSQACTMALLQSAPLASKLWELGFKRDAVVLRTVGQAWQAWSRPHLTQEARTKALFLLSTLVYRAFGSDLWDIRVLTRSHHGGIATNQLLDMINNSDVRADLLELIPGQQDASFKGNSEGFLLTKRNESMFSTLASVSGGKKPTAEFLLPRMDHIDVVSRIKEDLERGFSARRARLKRKMDDVFRSGYNDGTEDLFAGAGDNSGWMSMVRKRARQAARGRACNRAYAKKAL